MGQSLQQQQPTPQQRVYSAIPRTEQHLDSIRKLPDFVRHFQEIHGTLFNVFRGFTMLKPYSRTTE